MLTANGYRLSCYADASVGAKEREVLIAKELAELKDAKAELTTLFTTLLLGDQLAAEYLLCHLISSVHRYEEDRVVISFYYIVSFLFVFVILIIIDIVKTHF